MIVQSRKYINMQEAITVATFEEKVKGSNTALYKPNYKQIHINILTYCCKKDQQ